MTTNNDTTIAAHRAAFERALKKAYGIEPGDCTDLATLDREIAEAVHDAGGNVAAGIAAMVDAIGEKYDLDRLSA